MWVIAANGCVTEWVSSTVPPTFSNSAPCFVWISGPKRKCFGFFGTEQDPGLPPPQPPPPHHPYSPIHGVKVCLSFPLCKQSLVFDRFFFLSPSVGFGEERASLLDKVVWWAAAAAQHSLEVVCTFRKGSPQKWRQVAGLSLQQWHDASKWFIVFSLTSLVFFLFLSPWF